MKTQKSNNSDKIGNMPEKGAGRIKEKPSYERTDADIQQNYGFGHKADVDTHGEVTQRQEYTADGLPKMDKYTVDKVGRRHTYDSEPDASGEARPNYH